MNFAVKLRSLLVLGVLLAAFDAGAYPWMIRHGYTGCAACHVDPSGAGLLTPYGRAQLENLLPAHYGKKTEETSEKPALAFGWGQLPDWLNLGASFREALLTVSTPGAPTQVMPIDMVSDVRVEVSVWHAHAVVAVGFEPVGANLAALTTNPYDNLVSREHYLAFDVADQAVFLRAGRMELPFGLRNVEHPAWVRSETRTDVDSAQQYGVAAAYNGEGWRAEVMGIAGNFLVRDPDYWAHGYSGYAEHAFGQSFTLGVSSLVTQQSKDLYTSAPDTVRQAHGLFARWVVVQPLVLLGEVDALVQHSAGTPTQFGTTSFVQADYEPVQGLHFMVSGEHLVEYGQANFGAWAGVAYMFFPHCELRVDNIFREQGSPGGYVPVETLLAQLHLSI